MPNVPGQSANSRSRKSAHGATTNAQPNTAMLTPLHRLPCATVHANNPNHNASINDV
jgi:hypothetical protein